MARRDAVRRARDETEVAGHLVPDRRISGLGRLIVARGADDDVHLHGLLGASLEHVGRFEDAPYSERLVHDPEHRVVVGGEPRRDAQHGQHDHVRQIDAAERVRGTSFEGRTDRHHGSAIPRWPPSVRRGTVATRRDWCVRFPPRP